MSNIVKIIDGIIEREGPGFSNRTADRGGPTKFGITQSTLSQWRKHICTVEDVAELTSAEAHEIYTDMYVVPFADVKDETVRTQLIDFGVTSSPAASIKHAQQILGVEMDGHLGPETAHAINAAVPRDFSNKFAVARTKFYANIVHVQPSQAENINGWIGRALSFVV